MLVPSELSADLQVVRPHEGPMVHWAVLSWVHVSGDGAEAVRPRDPAVMWEHPLVLRLMPPSLQEFQATDWMPLLLEV